MAPGRRGCRAACTHLTSMVELFRSSPSQFQELLEAAQQHEGWSLQMCPNRAFPLSFRSVSSSSTCFAINWNFFTR